MKNGVPFHIAFGIAPERQHLATLDRLERQAASIHFAIFEGGKFNFDTMQFEDEK